MATRTVIVNPASASGRTAERWPAIVARLKTAGVDCDVVLTRSPDDASRLAREAVEAARRELVILGGDGTINEVVAGLVHADGSGMIADDVTLSIIHQGTGGDVARGIGIGHDEGRAINAAIHGPVRAVDVGVAEFQTEDGQRQTRAFLSCANVGMAAEVVTDVVGTLKRLGSTGAFAAATVRALLRNRPRPVRIVSSDPPWQHRTSIVDVIAANNRYMGGGMFVAPDARMDDGLLDLVVIESASRTRLLRTFPKVYRGSHVSDPLVTVRRTSRVRIETAEPAADALGVVLDGELVGTTPVEYRVLAHAINLRFPCTTSS